MKTRPLRVLHLTWAGDSSAGGGSIAAVRTVESLHGTGISAEIIARDGVSPKYQLPRGGFADRVVQKVTHRLGISDIHRLSTWAIRKHPLWLKADIIHFHVIHSGVFNYLLLPMMCRNKRVFMTLHDMWSVTGNCIYSYDCEGYLTRCGDCPYPTRYPPMLRDGSRISWILKNWVWAQLHLTTIAPSRWLFEIANKSMLRDSKIIHLPYAIDVQKYRPSDKEDFRSRNQIPDDKCVLLIAAQGLNDYRKGGGLLVAALRLIPDEVKNKCLLMLLGSGDLEGVDHLGIELRKLGFVGDESVRAQVYAGADLFLFASRADNLPLVLMEAMACGTPSIASNVGGVPDLIRPGETGDMFENDQPPEKIAELITEWVLSPEKRRRASDRCRHVAVSEYASSEIGSRLADLYRVGSAGQR